MRKIEKQMLDAIANGKNWRSGNTEVIQKEHGACLVTLHGNKIAWVHADGIVTPYIETLRRWPTPTTRSRLRALGVDVYTKNHITYLNNEEV